MHLCNRLETSNLLQSLQAFPWLYQYSGTFLRTFSTHVHTQSLPRPRDATSIDENWTPTERRVRHLERTVLGRYLLSCHTVTKVAPPGERQQTPACSWCLDFNPAWSGNGQFVSSGPSLAWAMSVHVSRCDNDTGNSPLFQIHAYTDSAAFWLTSPKRFSPQSRACGRHVLYK